MAYTVKSSERTRSSCAEHETKALLYLMNFRADSDDIYYFVVDFFNDLTGMNSMANRLWDVQSKGAHHVSPKAIGKELVTLFKNYMSEIAFEAYILFIGSVSSTLRINPALKVFGIENVQESAVKQIKAGIAEEGRSKEYINEATLTDTNIDEFLHAVQFVIDDDKKPSEYVKAIIKNHPHIIPENEEQILNAIFNEIRDKQSGKKNISKVEGVTIQTTDEALNYCRHLTNNEIRLMALQRIISRNPLDHGIPFPFLEICNTWAPEQQKEMIEESQSALCRALFNKNAADGFWFLFENTYQSIVNHPDESVNELFQHICAVPNCVSRCPDFDAISLKYFIALVKDSIQQ